MISSFLCRSQNTTLERTRGVVKLHFWICRCAISTSIPHIIITTEHSVLPRSSGNRPVESLPESCPRYAPPGTSALPSGPSDLGTGVLAFHSSTSNPKSVALGYYSKSKMSGFFRILDFRGKREPQRGSSVHVDALWLISDMCTHLPHPGGRVRTITTIAVPRDVVAEYGLLTTLLDTRRCAFENLPICMCLQLHPETREL